MKELLQQKLQGRFIIAPNKLIDSNVSAEAITAYLLMKENVSNSNIGELTLKMIAEKLADNNIDRVIKKLRPAIQELIELGVVGLFDCSFNEANINEFKANDTMVVCFEDCVGAFFKVSYIEYRAVLELSKGVKKGFALVAYFTAVMRFTNSNHAVVGFVAPKIWKKYVSDNRTIKEYQELLAENDIISVVDDGYYTPKTGKSVGARVARTEHYTEEQLEKAVDYMAQRSGWVKTNREQTNEKISKSMKKYHASKEVQDETFKTETEEVSSTVLVKGFDEDAYIDLRALLKAGKLSEEKYIDYMNEAQEKSFICDIDEILIQMIGEM
ncbi:hypothetical protein [Zhenhengia yiwuensis]|uniref:hypothetical protein n=1 Tax=Zhenhengia yiwuensis TaxID=2763666 RepID=UPI002A75E3AF|nr:hypothetical protein [Zhenhengia yiwuensis]MDY3368388.1 hypothetical protein [Zhenhengia yiwuensis]